MLTVSVAATAGSGFATSFAGVTLSGDSIKLGYESRRAPGTEVAGLLPSISATSICKSLKSPNPERAVLVNEVLAKDLFISRLGSTDRSLTGVLDYLTRCYPWV